MARHTAGMVAFLSFGAMQTTGLATEVYFNDFDGHASNGVGVVVGTSGIQTTEAVQGYSGVGAGTNRFGGNFIRNTSGQLAGASTFTLQNLPPHAAVTVKLLFAAIDSWDGSSFPPAPSQAPDFFTVRANGTVLFQETFTNLSAFGALQSYAGPALAREQQLGFEAGSSRLDSAYELMVTVAGESRELTLEFYAGGGGWHASGGASDESWGMDNLRVSVPEPGDFNSDGVVNAADLGILDNGFAHGLTGYGNGDFDGSGVIDRDDYAQFDRALARATAVPGLGNLPVPEPGACGGLGVASMVCLYRRRSRSRGAKRPTAPTVGLG